MEHATPHMHRIPVTERLSERILEIAEADGTWRTFDADWWPASFALAWKIANGRQQTTTPAVYEAVGLQPPAVLHVVLGDGASVFGKVGLLESDVAEEVRIVVLEPQDLDGYEMRACAVCDAEFFVPAWLNRKYCRRHDWASGWQRSAAGREWRAEGGDDDRED